jgi:hypothetical protein
VTFQLCRVRDISTLLQQRACRTPDGGRASGRYPTALRAELIGIIRKRYSDFGPTLLKRPRRSMRHVHASRSGPVHFHQPFLAPKTEFNGVGGLRTHIRPVPICGTFQKL